LADRSPELPKTPPPTTILDRDKEFDSGSRIVHLSNPGAFYWGAPLSLEPQQPHYPGKVVILVDEISQSQAEYTTMAFRSSPRATVIGSTTAGADGNVSRFRCPADSAR
jgi:hypothetical protein